MKVDSSGCQECPHEENSELWDCLRAVPISLPGGFCIMLTAVLLRKVLSLFLTLLLEMAFTNLKA